MPSDSTIRDRISRSRRVGALGLIAVLLATTGLASTFAPVFGAPDARTRVDLDAFMAGLACTESGGRYDAVNKDSGAFGKYQFMPRIWRAWAARYLNDRWAEPTPSNQEYVARERILALWDLHGRWRLVAHWWLTGNADDDESLWSRGSTRYVNRVMKYSHWAALGRNAGALPRRCFAPRSLQPSIRTEPRPQVKVAGGRIFLRKAAGYENRALGTAKQGTRLTVLGRDRDPRGKLWLYVGLFDGRTGWVASWLTRPVSD